jgi:hypothetical protein
MYSKCAAVEPGTSRPSSPEEYVSFPSSNEYFQQAQLTAETVEIVGFAARTYSASQTPNWSTGPYIIQTILLLVAPALFAASIYMILGRIILMTDGETHSIVKRRWLTKLFVLGDVVSFTVQAGGKSPSLLRHC